MSTAVISTNLTLSDQDSAREGDWLYLEQDLPYENFTTNDLYQMWMLAKAGQTARNHSPVECNVKFNQEKIIFTIDFNVFPSRMDLPYDVSVSLGELTEVVGLQRDREFGVFFNKQSSVKTGKIFDSLEFDHRSPCFNLFGEQIPIPELEVSNEVITAPEDIFLVSRAKGTENGFTHTVYFELDLYDDKGNKLLYSNIQCTVTATWTDEEGKLQTESLALEIPKCVEDALNICQGDITLICSNCHDVRYIVYFSSCTGEILEVRKKDLYEDQSWCLPA